MKSSRARRQRDLGELPAATRLHVVSRNVPARPRWGHLYLALVAAVAVGTGLHFSVHDPWLGEAVDLLLWLVLFLALAGWIHVNRLALARLDEPDAGPSRPQVRIVRSRKKHESSPDERIIFPFDVR